jgi:WD40 repeat protein
VFISYARDDQPFVRRLHDALVARGQQPWVDWEGIPPTAEWMAEIRKAIERADSFIFVITPHSASSRVCQEEAEHASASGKRLIPIVRADVDAAQLPQPIAARNWIFFRDRDDFGAAADTLNRALETDLAWVQAHSRFLVRAKEWRESGADRSLLVRGRELRAAEEWLAEASRHPEPTPTAEQSDFIMASRRAAASTQRVRVAALSIALAISTALAVFAFAQQRRAEEQARVAESGRLAANSRAEADADPELGLRLALEAARTSPTLVAEQQLRDVLDSYPVRQILPHPDVLNWAEYSADGERLVTACSDGLVRIFETDDWSLEMALQGHRSPVTAAAFRPDGKHVASVASDGTVLVWDVETGQRLLAMRGHGGEAAEPQLADEGLDARITGVAYNPGGSRILTVGRDGLGVIWDANLGKRLRVLVGHRSELVGGQFSPDGRMVATASADGTAAIWDSRTGRRLRILRGPSGTVWSASFDPKSKLVATGHDTGTVVIWDARSGKVVHTFAANEEMILSARFHPEPQVAHSLVLLTAGFGGSALWLVDQEGKGRQVANYPAGVSMATFSSDGKDVATAGSDGTVRVWDTLEGEITLRAPQGIQDAAYMRATSTVVTAGNGVGIWDVENGHLLRSFGAGTRFWGVDPSPDGTRVTGIDFDGRVHIWDASSGQLLRVLQDRPAQERAGNPVPPSAEFSPNGSRIATVSGGDDSVSIWAASEGGLLKTLTGHTAEISDVSWSPDGTRVVTASLDRTARVWDPETGQTVTTLRGHRSGLLAAQFSPDGWHVVTAGEDLTARVWDSSSGEPVMVLRGHAAFVTSASYSNDGQRIVTASGDGTARVWDADSGKFLDIFRGHGRPVWTAEFVLNDQRVMTTDPFGTAMVFTCELCLPLKGLISLGEARVSHELNRI